MLGLLLAGSSILVVGLLAIGFGIPVKEFSFGNTLIVTGVLGSCTGVILVALALVLRELKGISLALASGSRPGAAVREPAMTGAAIAPLAPPLAREVSPEATSEPSETPPWHEESAARARPPAPDHDHVPVPAPEPPAKKRRNLLFMSTRRDRTQGQDEAPASGDDHESVAEPASTAQPHPSFEDAWPVSERTRPDSKRRPARSADSSDAPPVVAPPPPLRRPAESPPVTILKSGVVDGMAYSLYSDGSIEAQMPEGMVRFGSIDELRDHLDQRGV